ncbi:hypothetical protein RHMOL_Rhmol05G0135200 [Rhododendron molle]|uniref:Uncharacterized protein n=1 Tax=Rhododendron molle TaxID=49168 RepID=A0ACC0NNH7_RHOML|nr:hypothetical protein RHMOL_Rhmol05G0135200 [Rhododendron molle]
MGILRVRHHIPIYVPSKHRNCGSMISHFHSSSRFLPSKLSLAVSIVILGLLLVVILSFEL